MSKVYCANCASYVQSPCTDPDCPVEDTSDIAETEDSVDAIRFDDLEESDYFGDPADSIEFSDVGGDYDYGRDPDSEDA